MNSAGSQKPAATPTFGPVPAPPFQLKKTEWLCPTTAITPANTWATNGEPKFNCWPSQRAPHTATAPADADPLEGLDPLFLPLTDAVQHPDRVPGSELGDVLTKLLLFERSQQIRHVSPLVARVDRDFQTDR